MIFTCILTGRTRFFNLSTIKLSCGMAKEQFFVSKETQMYSIN